MEISTVIWNFYSIAEDTTYLSHRTCRHQTGTNIEVSFTLRSLHSAGRFYVYSLPGMKSNQYSYLARHSVSYNNDRPEKL